MNPRDWPEWGGPWGVQQMTEPGEEWLVALPCTAPIVVIIASVWPRLVKPAGYASEGVDRVIVPDVLYRLCVISAYNSSSFGAWKRAARQLVRYPKSKNAQRLLAVFAMAGGE